MTRYAVWRGRDGRIDPEDRARFDVAVQTSDTIAARIGEVEAARDVAGDHAEEAGAQADIATDAVVITLAQADAAEISAGLADQRAGAAQTSATTALGFRNETAAMASAAATGARFFETIALGRAAVADGATFGVRLVGPDGVIRPNIYRRDSATTQTLVVTLPNSTEVDSAKLRTEETRAELQKVAGVDNTSFAGENPFELTDSEGNRFLVVDPDFSLSMFGGAKLDVRAQTWPFAFTDMEGNVFAGYRDGRWYFDGQTGDQGGSWLDALDARNRDRSQEITEQIRYGVQLPVTDSSVIVMLGQSLARGQETWPSLSKDPVPGAVMIGGNADSTSISGTYTHVGAYELNPLVANTRSGGSNLTGAQEAALAPGATNFGEIPVIGMVNGLKRWLNRKALRANDGRQLIALSVAVSGRTVEQLSKTPPEGTGDHYGFFTDGVDKALGLAPDAVVPVVGFAQGEYNYVSTHGGDTTRAGYLARLAAYFTDVAADILTAVPNQTEPPLIVSYQTGAAYTRDVDANGQPGLAIGMAQLDLALAGGNVVLACPAYPFTDKGGHLDSNGSRWMGHYMAKAAREIWEGRNFQPVRPLQVTVEGSEVYIHYHVPVAPLVFDTPYVSNSGPVDYPTKGFRVTSADGLSASTIQAVTIERPTIIKITLAAPPPAGALLWYAPQASMQGNGCVRDSDPALASDLYEYVPERGMYPAANIPRLIGKPYPLHNWSIAFCIPVTYSEFL
ncbi:hypothetical protein E4191_07550 [Paracoccus liaowanqingii]|uniref:Sialate O-acetylesterase domain-containing protein n=1 Tax=Paracoccus liaowanqingii TaxID=2560053 RepID=A0A4P7HLN4_9RHOB|nr:hypothetical protein [Paracoccus liaowanqingii]QBX34580.1 hypothetical protein E4191_07550 [Paracoccus liaowanqingii]